MTKYFITVLKYYMFDADSDDESPAIEMHRYTDDGEHLTLWNESDGFKQTKTNLLTGIKTEL